MLAGMTSGSLPAEQAVGRTGWRRLPDLGEALRLLLQADGALFQHATGDWSVVETQAGRRQSREPAAQCGVVEVGLVPTPWILLPVQLLVGGQRIVAGILIARQRLRGVGFVDQAFPVRLVLTAALSACRTKAVRREICATALFGPSFHTTAASTFFPARNCGAMSTVSYRQCRRSPRAGPQETRAPLAKSS